jgi:hypothetical protein
MAEETCPRCGDVLVRRGGRGRPRRWCSDECRYLASKEHRAAERGLTIHTRVEENVACPSLGPERAVDYALRSGLSVDQLLRTLTQRMKATPIDKVDKRSAGETVPLIADLLAAYSQAAGFVERPTSRHHSKRSWPSSTAPTQPAT